MSNPNVMDEPDLIEIKQFMHITFDKIKNCTYKDVEDIDLENLRPFLYEALKSYQRQEISSVDLINITDALTTFMHRRYMDDYPETLYPTFPSIHPYSIGLNVMECIHDLKVADQFSDEIVEDLLNYVTTPLGQEQKANDSMDELLKKLDLILFPKKHN